MAVRWVKREFFSSLTKHTWVWVIQRGDREQNRQMAYAAIFAQNERERRKN